MPFVLISPSGELATDHQIEAACAARNLRCVKVVPGATRGLDLGPADERRWIYRTGVNLACLTLEKLLYRAGDAALHDPFFHYANQQLIFQRAGLPRPRTVYVPDPEPQALASQVAGLGGFPVVLKLSGTERGMGVSLIHDLETLSAAITEARSTPSLEAYFPHVRSWRVTVLGGRMLAASARVAAEGDFRTNSPGSAMVDAGPPPQGLEAIAVRAAAVLNLDFGGADILESADGALILSELNFPCFFADQPADIAGAIVDHLIALPPHPTAGRW